MFSEADSGSCDPAGSAFSVATPGVYFRERLFSEVPLRFRFRFAIRKQQWPPSSSRLLPLLNSGSVSGTAGFGREQSSRGVGRPGRLMAKAEACVRSRRAAGDCSGAGACRRAIASGLPGLGAGEGRDFRCAGRPSCSHGSADMRRVCRSRGVSIAKRQWGCVKARSGSWLGGCSARGLDDSGFVCEYDGLDSVAEVEFAE